MVSFSVKEVLLISGLIILPSSSLFSLEIISAFSYASSYAILNIACSISPSAITASLAALVPPTKSFKA